MTITKDLKQKIAKVAKRHQLDLVIVFGSRATGATHQKSDIDIAVLPKKTKDLTMKKYSVLLYDLGKIFGDIKVDIALIPRADPLLLDNINNSGQLLFGSKRDFIKFKLYAFKRFCNYQPYFKLEEDAVHKLIKQLAYSRWHKFFNRPCR